MIYKRIMGEKLRRIKNIKTKIIQEINFGSVNDVCILIHIERQTILG